MNSKHMRFCEEYVKDNNATQAAIRAGYTASSARNQAHRLMANAEVLEMISNLKKELTEQCHIEAHVVLALLKKDAIDPDNPASARVSALTVLAKYLNLIGERIHHTGSINAPSVIRRIAMYRDQDGNLREADVEDLDDEEIPTYKN